jgi:hypothetical protein
MIEPLHIATIDGQPLRIFKSPRNDGIPDLPWHAVDDLQQCLRLNRQQRKVPPARVGAALEKWADFLTGLTRPKLAESGHTGVG